MVCVCRCGRRSRSAVIPSCTVPVEDERVSWRHLRIEPKNGQLEILDLESKNGTFLNARGWTPGRSSSPATPWSSSARRGSGCAERRSSTAEISGRFRRVQLRDRPLRIGRSPDNDVVLEEPNVSWHHAELRPGSPPTIVDLGSRNGVRLERAADPGEEPLRARRRRRHRALRPPPRPRRAGDQRRARRAAHRLRGLRRDRRRGGSCSRPT